MCLKSLDNKFSDRLGQMVIFLKSLDNPGYILKKRSSKTYNSLHTHLRYRWPFLNYSRNMEPGKQSFYFYLFPWRVPITWTVKKFFAPQMIFFMTF